MVQNPIERFAKLEKIEYPNAWLAQHKKKIYKSLAGVKTKKGFIVLVPYNQYDYNDLYEWAWKQGINNYKIYHIKQKTFWVVEQGESRVNNNFGVWAISEQLFDWMVDNIPKSSTILELGSGTGTIELAKHFNMISIEHDHKWLNKAKSHYIHAPIVDNWYDRKVLERDLIEPYDAILVDGPPAKYGRSGFYENLDLFLTDVPIIFDDVNRTEELELMKKVAKKLKKEAKVFQTEDKYFGVIQ